MIHKAKKIDLELRIIQATKFWSRMKGLLFHKTPIVDEGLLISKCNSIHMFFMRFPIDVVFLNQSNTVVKVFLNVKPWTFITPIRDACSTLELPSGTIDKNNICVGDMINL